MAPLALIVLALLGSVVIPARQTSSITELLRHTNEVLGPARVAESGLRSLYSEIIRPRRPRTNDMAGRRSSPAAFAAAIAAAQPHYAAALNAIDDLSADLAAETAVRDDRVRALERSSLVWNAVLVLAALAVLSGVVILMLRERRLAAVIRRRVGEESALRQLARTLSGAMTLDEAMQATVAGALATASASGAYLEWIVAEEERLDVVVGFDHQPVPPRNRISNVGSLTSTIMAHENADGLMMFDAIGPRLPVHIRASCDQCFGLVAPLSRPRGRSVRSFSSAVIQRRHSGKMSVARSSSSAISLRQRCAVWMEWRRNAAHWMTLAGGRDRRSPYEKPPRRSLARSPWTP